MPLQFRLEIRLILLAKYDDECRAMLLAFAETCDHFGVFYDLLIEPYWKIKGAVLARVEFDLFKCPLNLIEDAIEVLGGTGWHIIGEGKEKEAIWERKDDTLPPCNDRVIWSQIQVIPYSSLSENQKRRKN